VETAVSAEEGPTEESDRGDRGQHERDASEDEDPCQDPAKPAARNDRRVGPATRGAHPAQARERGQGRLGHKKAGAEWRDERVALIGGGQQAERMVAVVRGEGAHRELLGELDSVDQALLGAQAAESPDLARCEEEDHEERIEDRGRRSEEVIVVTRHELPELVDERAKPGSADDRRDQTRRGGQIQEQQGDRDEHPEPAPEHMGDVQASAAELGIAGRFEEDADDHDRRDGRHEECVQEIRVGRADEMSRGDVHPAIVSLTREAAPFGRPPYYKTWSDYSWALMSASVGSASSSASRPSPPSSSSSSRSSRESSSGGSTGIVSSSSVPKSPASARAFGIQSS